MNTDDDVRRQKKMEPKKKKKKRKHAADDDEDDDDDDARPTIAGIVPISSKEPKTKKKKKKKKKQKLDHNDNADENMDDTQKEGEETAEETKQEDEYEKKENKQAKRKKKKEKAHTKEKKKKKNMLVFSSPSESLVAPTETPPASNTHTSSVTPTRPLVSSSAMELYTTTNDNATTATAPKTSTKRSPNNKVNVDVEIKKQHDYTLSLLLFYQYITPEWDEGTYDYMLSTFQKLGTNLSLTGRMRCAKEGVNCTLTGTHTHIVQFCTALQQLTTKPNTTTTSSRQHDFATTEFKITTKLPVAQQFTELKLLPVTEIVNYGLQTTKVPRMFRQTTTPNPTTDQDAKEEASSTLASSSSYAGIHLEPTEYHHKLGQNNTVIIDVRNYYETAIGRFVPPPTATAETTATTATTTPKLPAIEVDDEDDNDEKKKKDKKEKKSKKKKKKKKSSSEQEEDEEEKLDSNNNNNKEQQQQPPVWLNPKMRKSTEFPAWLDQESTKEQLKGKQVLMYCTGGIRCERASALLNYKLKNDATMQDLNVKGVYQLQGGIDKYFKEFPDGGYWHGKNYVFDKRFAHAPPKIDGRAHGGSNNNNPNSNSKSNIMEDTNNGANTERSNASTNTATRGDAGVENGSSIMGKCEACQKPWDMYRGKRRCPTCGVPSLICKDCFRTKSKQELKKVRCELCVEQNIRTKQQYKEQDCSFIAHYENKMIAKGLIEPPSSSSLSASASGRIVGFDNGSNNRRNRNHNTNFELPDNPNKTTRLFVKNMCTKQTTTEALKAVLENTTTSEKDADDPAVGICITHIAWKIDHRRKRNNDDDDDGFMGMGWIEMNTPEAASRVVGLSQMGKVSMFGQKLQIVFQPPDGKDIWPPPNSKV